MIKFNKYENKLILIYTPDYDISWVAKRIEKNEKVTLCQSIFTFYRSELLTKNDESDDEFYEEYLFLLGILEGEYYRINKDILSIKHDLLLHETVTIDINTFRASYGTSIFSKIDALINEPIIIGGNHPKGIPKEDFYALLKVFPAKTELKHYVNSRITMHLRAYLATMEDSKTKYQTYISKKDSKAIISYTSQTEIKEHELKKYTFISAELQAMLNHSSEFLEKVWQKKITDILLLLFPKYIKLLENIAIKDEYSKVAKSTIRFIDFILLDSNGSIDIVEIKRPFEQHILSHGKYRDNHTPHHELAGAIMQIEKYLFHLSKWGKSGEVW